MSVLIFYLRYFGVSSSLFESQYQYRIFNDYFKNISKLWWSVFFLSLTSNFMFEFWVWNHLLRLMWDSLCDPNNYCIYVQSSEKIHYFLKIQYAAVDIFERSNISLEVLLSGFELSSNCRNESEILVIDLILNVVCSLEMRVKCLFLYFDDW